MPTPALNFPPNPVDGEIFGNYRWDDTIGVWRLLPPITATGVSIGIVLALG